MKKQLFLFLLLFGNYFLTLAQSGDELANRASAAYFNKNFAESASLYQQAIEHGAREANIYYNAACSFALAGDAENALKYIELAIRNGYANAAHLQKDTDLQMLHADDRWPRVVKNCEARAEAEKMHWNSPSMEIPYKAELTHTEKVAGLSKLWSEAKYNFVNFELVPTLDWDGVYLEYLGRMEETKSTADYYRLLMEMVARLQDGHSNVYPPKELFNDFYARPAFRTRLIEDKVLVTEVFDEQLKKQGIREGIELIRVNQLPVKTYAEEHIRPYQSASTPQDLDVRTFEYFLLGGAAGETLELDFADQKGKPFTVSTNRLSVEEQQQLKDPSPAFSLKWLKGNIALVELNTFGSNEAADEFLKAFEEIAKAEAIIFDVRNNGGGNSGVGYKVLSCLTKDPIPTSSWYTRDYRPSFRAWGNAEGRYGRDNNSVPAEGNLFYDKPVVVLTSPRTYSAAEDFAVAFDAMERGLIIGEATGGSTGQPLFFSLPGGGNARICTKRDTYPDGKEFVGVGVQPDIMIVPRVEDFRKGKDIVLEAALMEIKKKK